MYRQFLVFNNSTASCAAIANAGQAWFDLSESPNIIGGGPLVLNVDSDFDKEKTNLVVAAAKVTTFPTILFVEILDNQGNTRIITRLTGCNQSLTRIKDTYQRVINGQFGKDGNGNQVGENLPLPSGEGGIGLGGGFDFQLPNIAWILLTIFAASKTTSAKGVKQIGYGALTAYSASKVDFKSLL